MEIISASNTQFRDFTAAHQRHETEINRFREIFDRATESQEVDRAAIRNAAEMFESYFLQLMFREMRKTSENERTFIPKSHAERIFTDMMDEEVAKNAASAGGVGLADMIYKQMTRHLD
jgi:flagellar protein FlgJ